MPVYAESPFDIAAMQGGFRFDATIMSFSRVIPNRETGVDEYQFGAAKADEGELRFAWIAEDGVSLLPRRALLFTLEFEVKTGAGFPTGQFCWLSDQILKNLAYPMDGREIPAQLAWENAGQKNAGIALMASPNPFRDVAKIFVYSELAREGILRMQDQRGQIQMQQPIQLVTGDNAFEIQTDAPPGLYVVSIQAGDQTAQLKLLKL